MDIYLIGLFFVFLIGLIFSRKMHAELKLIHLFIMIIYPVCALFLVVGLIWLALGGTTFEEKAVDYDA